MTDSNDVENPYLQNQQDFNSLIDRAHINAAMWRNFGLINLFITLLAVAGMIYVGSLPKVVPYLFKEDASGGITPLGIPNEKLEVDNKLIANQLVNFIIALRQIPSDNALRSQYVHLVLDMAAANLFSQKLAPMLKSRYISAGNDDVMVQVNTVLPLGANLWEIDWSEFSGPRKIGKFKASISYSRNLDLKEPSQMIFNPLGLVVRAVEIDQTVEYQ